jgi:ribulose-phosphate 3-epimerase
MTHSVVQATLTDAAPHILPALLECDYTRLGEVLAECEAAGAKALHFDIMDGHFVPNLTYGPPFLRSLRRATQLIFDAHLMIANPEKYVEDYCRAGCDIVTIHIEAAPDPRKLLAQIHAQGQLAGLALSPATPIESVAPYLEEVDLILPMSVKPGFGGQKFDPVALEKLRWLRENGPKHLLLECDGGLNRETLPNVVQAGAQLCVVGSALFRAEDFGGEFQRLAGLARGG